MTNAVIGVNWPGVSDPLKVRLEDPDGNVVSPGGGVEVIETATHVVYRIPTMDKGTWKLRVAEPGQGDRLGRHGRRPAGQRHDDVDQRR